MDNAHIGCAAVVVNIVKPHQLHNCEFISFFVSSLILGISEWSVRYYHTTPLSDVFSSLPIPFLLRFV
jgi:uncharacterized membrane protein YjjB (DUF3815 family)